MTTPFEPLAVSGMGICCAVGNSIPQFRAALAEGRVGLRELRLDDGFSTPVGEVSLPGGSRWRGASDLDRTTQLALLAAGDAVRSASLPEETLADGRTGIVIGHTGDDDAAGLFYQAV